MSGYDASISKVIPFSVTRIIVIIRKNGSSTSTRWDKVKGNIMALRFTISHG
jgi:hypothetical protein